MEAGMQTSCLALPVFIPHLAPRSQQSGIALMSPARYVAVKTIIIKDHLQKREGIPSESRLPSYLDKVLKKRILNFLTESRWISRDAS